MKDLTLRKITITQNKICKVWATIIKVTLKNGKTVFPVTLVVGKIKLVNYNCSTFIEASSLYKELVIILKKFKL